MALAMALSIAPENPALPDTAAPLLTTPLNSLHLELGARMVPFAGYSMPVQYPMGLMQEHLHTRAAAGLFDVSHMGQLRLIGTDAASVQADRFAAAIKRFGWALIFLRSSMRASSQAISS